MTLTDLDAEFVGNFRPTMLTAGMGVITDEFALDVETHLPAICRYSSI